MSSSDVVAQSVLNMQGIIEAAAKAHGDIGYAAAIQDVRRVMDANGHVTRDDLLVLLQARERASHG